MNPERWQQIEQLFHSALGQDRGERDAFLAQACVGDELLHEEVESLLASHDQATSFIEMPAGDAAAELLEERHTRLMPATMVNRYKILGLLGKGGMGEVYLAEDTELHRRIALKVLPGGFTRDSDRVRRFVQEAHTASALNHPNIITIHEIGRLDDTHFIVTEFIEGQTLREQFRSGGILLTDALDVAIQVASALDAAHAAGIVHRDIKPENIMVRRDGYIKVLDFGLAKLAENPMSSQDLETAREPVGTNPGIVMGTVNYMSPEQARGLDVDTRTDLWSLGVVLYEMVTGRVPFRGETSSHVVVSILESEPAPDSELPPGLAQIVTRTLCKDKNKRYQTAGELTVDLKSLKQDLEADVRFQNPLHPHRKGGDCDTWSDGHPAAETTNRSTEDTSDATEKQSTLSAEYLISEVKRHKLVAVLVAAALVIMVAGVIYSFYSARRGESVAPSGAAIDSIAVLPFVNVNKDPNTEYLSDGISDSIINSLSQLPMLKVMSLNSVLHYKGTQTDPKAVGRELNVRAVLMGRLTKQGDSLVISAELVDVRDNRRLWGEQYNRKLSDIMVVQTEIAREISEKLRLRLTGEEKRQLAKRYTENSEAYRLCLLGRYYSGKLTEAGWEKAIDYFEQAIKEDPSYAPAYVGLANSYAELRGRGSVPPREALQKQESAVRKALEIDDTLAEAHVALAAIRGYYEDRSAADRELKYALELNPNSVGAHWAYASHLDAMGRFDEAILEMKRVHELDPLSLEANAAVGMPFYFARQYDQAIEQFKKTIEMEPNFAPAHHRLAMAYAQKGMYKEAIAESSEARALDNAPQRWGRFAALAYVYALSGNTNEARKMLDELKELAKQRYIPPGNFALIYAGLGEKDQAFAWLEKAYETHSVYAFIKVDPMYDSLRSDPRFTDLLRRMNLAA